MPIYEYVCLDCGDQFEILRAMNDADTPIACQTCNSEHTSRMLSLFNAKSGDRVVAGGSSACTSCASSACSSCKVR